VIYLPIFFICLAGGECDFVHAKPVPTQGDLRDHERRVRAAPGSRREDRGVQVDLRSSGHVKRAWSKDILFVGLLLPFSPKGGVLYKLDKQERNTK
jgi:hypothetical protein